MVRIVNLLRSPFLRGTLLLLPLLLGALANKLDNFDNLEDTIVDKTLKVFFDNLASCLELPPQDHINDPGGGSE